LVNLRRSGEKFSLEGYQMSFHRSAAVAATLSALIAGPAAAATQYIAEISGTLIGPTGASSQFADGSVTVSNPDPTRLGRTATDWQVGADAVAVHGGTADSNIQMSPIPTVGGVGYAQTLLSQSTILYRITLNGSATDPLVPVHINAQGMISWTENGAAQAVFQFSDSTNASNLQTIRDLITQNDPGKARLEGNDVFSVDTTVFLRPSDTYTVLLATDASADARNIESVTQFAEVSAIVDPTFTVVGDFASRWTIEGVPFAPDTGGVPEPAAWMMLIAGFGLAGTSLRRRRAPALSGRA
jgi:hypothetical protein